MGFYLDEDFGKGAPDLNSDEVCSCDGDLMNCDDFDTQIEAQACFNYCGSEDVHGLDKDGNGIACESLG